MKTSTRIHQAAVRTFAAALLAIGLTACAGITAPSQQDRLAKAQAMFAERCKTAGEKIYRTVDNVEGIYLMKLRPTQNFGGQFDLDDPYGNDLFGDGYIESFLRGSYRSGDAKRASGAPPRIGYLYVEAIDPQDGKLYRYSGEVREYEVVSSVLIGGNGQKFKTKGFMLDRLQTSKSVSRYGVTYEDISTREEREYWIAGSSLKVVDLQTNQVLAERIGYMMDVGQGSKAGGRAPWLMAADHACPDFHRFPNPVVIVPGSAAQSRQTQDFVEKILAPKQ